jgi:hypothetical protein
VRKTLVAVFIAGALFLVLGGGEALAAFCTNTAKPDGAGNVGDLIIDVSTGEPSSMPTNPGGRVAGGFVDVWLDFNGDGIADQKVIDDTFLLPANPALGEPAELPHGARNAGPGDDLCDGIGIDDVGACGP